MNEDHYFLFEQYLQNELTNKELEQFETLLYNDADIAEAFTIYKELNQHLHQKFSNTTSLNEFKTNLVKVSSNHFKPKKTIFKIQSWQYAAAASVLLCIGLFFYKNMQQPNFNNYYQHENAYLAERSNVDNLVQKAEQAYNNRKVKAAIPLFESLLQKNNSPEIQYFYGVSLLENNQTEKAKEVFVVLQKGTSIYKHKATWNLALLSLKEKNYEECKKQLKIIPEDYENFGQVQQLLKKLD